MTMPTVYTYVGSIDIEMTDEDVQFICQSGNNDYEVAEVLKRPYIKDQLKNIETEKLLQSVSYCLGDPLEDKSRESLENYLVWLAAWNIIEGDCHIVDVA